MEERGKAGGVTMDDEHGKAGRVTMDECGKVGCITMDVGEEETGVSDHINCQDSQITGKSSSMDEDSLYKSREKCKPKSCIVAETTFTVQVKGYHSEGRYRLTEKERSVLPEVDLKTGQGVLIYVYYMKGQKGILRPELVSAKYPLPPAENYLRFSNSPYCKQCDGFLLRAETVPDHLKTYHEDLCPCCHICYEQFGNNGLVYEHCRNVHKTQGRILCKECLRTFTDPWHLRDHMVNHLNKKAFMCTFCAKTFNTKTSVNQHETFCRSSGTKKKRTSKYYKCKGCHFVGHSSTVLQHHVSKVHKNVSYLCATCGKCFWKEVVLKRHRLSHLSQKAYKCSECDADFIQKCTMIRHVFNVHRGGRYECTQCKENFCQTYSLNKHMTNKHNATAQDITMAIDKSQVKYSYDASGGRCKSYP